MTSHNESERPQGAPAERKPPPPHVRITLQALGFLFTAIGFAGVILPIVPGVPLLLLAAACFAKSSPRLEHWLVTHPLLGPGIVAWRERGAISPKSKTLAVAMISISGFFVCSSGVYTVLKILIISGMIGAAIFILTRPNH